MTILSRKISFLGVVVDVKFRNGLYTLIKNVFHKILMDFTSALIHIAPLFRANLTRTIIIRTTQARVNLTRTIIIRTTQAPQSYTHQPNAHQPYTRRILTLNNTYLLISIFQIFEWLKKTNKQNIFYQSRNFGKIILFSRKNQTTF